jgi:hypothetical protein
VAEVSKSQQKVSTKTQQNATGKPQKTSTVRGKKPEKTSHFQTHKVNKTSTANCSNDLAVSISGIQRGIHGIVGYQGFGYQAWLPRKHDFLVSKS